MSASELQQQRTKSYFIDAAKEILRGEGLKVASARNIAERAGYSYATLYNYFDDLTALIFECVRDFQTEIDRSVKTAADKARSPEEKIRAGITAWVNYFVQYPGIFELFFLERIGEAGTRSDIADIIYNSISPACIPGLKSLTAEGILTEKAAEQKLDMLRFQTTGLMLYYSNRKNPSDYNGLIQMLNRQFDTLLG